MSYRRRKHYYSKRMSRDEEFQWWIVTIVFVVCFIFYLSWGFLSNCIFEWPIRWDVGTCWHEQIKPAKEKASEKASEKAVNFIP